MRRWGKSGLAAGAAALLLLATAAPLSAQPPGFAPPCDQYDPHAPASTARITLDSADLINRRGDEMRSFIDTGSIGKADVMVISAPPGAVMGVSATPEISRYSPYYGENLKGIAVAVALGPSRRPARIVLEVRQVCARHFLNTFLYY